MAQMNSIFEKRTLLVADDIEMNKSIVKKIFGEKYRVLTAKNGREALDILKSTVVDILLLDIQMPVMDGYQVIGEMKSDENLSCIPIVVTTGAVDKSERKAFDLGADDFITQPYDPYIMRKRVENLLDRYELREMRSAVQEQQRFRDLFDILGIAYWEWTKTGGVFFSEKYRDYAISDLEESKMWDGESPFHYIHPDDVGLMRQFMQKHDDSEIKKSAVVRCLMKDGSYRWTEMFSIAESAPDGHLARLVSIMRDVDKEWLVQKEQLESALKEAQYANRAKTAFLSRISHDMRTPLNGILGLTTLLKESIADERLKKDLIELEISGQYLLNLINDTLDVSRIESGKLELHPVVCNGRDLFNNMLSMVKMGIVSKNITLKVNADGIPFSTLYVDVGRIEQVVMNIIGNAIKFTPVGGRITVTMKNISVENGIITDILTVEDTGIGMSPEFLPHIFETFSQEDASLTSSHQGTGLGMAITKQLLALMNGDITAESELGKGSRFIVTLRLPIATEEQISQNKSISSGFEDGLLLRGKRILLCEDHPLNTTIATRILVSKGVTVEHAENGRIGTEMFAASDEGYYDAILMDIRMPEMDGLEASRLIRSMPRADSRTVPIIAMTANAFNDDIRQTKEAGMNAHLSKPIQTEQLYKTLEEQMDICRSFRRQRVLIVDDVELNREVIRASLEQDYDICEAKDGEGALEFIEKNPDIDAIITDIQMPGMNGLELIKKIRCKDCYNHIVIIANTQFGDPEQEEQLLSIGANDFVYKPTTPRIVEIRVRNALKRI